jgi:hypothetical protein
MDYKNKPKRKRLTNKEKIKKNITDWVKQFLNQFLQQKNEPIKPLIQK